jgi:hypothetical protein
MESRAVFVGGNDRIHFINISEALPSSSRWMKTQKFKGKRNGTAGTNGVISNDSISCPLGSTSHVASGGSAFFNRLISSKVMLAAGAIKRSSDD